MKMRATRGVYLCAPAALFVAATAAHAGLTTWQRSHDWVPGAAQGSTEGNPGPVGGIPTWQYEVTHGGALGSQNPWYAQPSQLMTWDSGWYQTGWGVWSGGDDLNPPILAGRLIHNVHPTTYDNIPLVRWMNPIGDGGIVNLTGTLTINWNGVNGLGRPVDVDVVIAMQDAQTHAMTVLYSATVSKPNPFPSVGDSVNLPVSLLGIHIDAGDSIVFSERGKNAVGPLGAWVNMYDSILITQVVPAPGSLAVIGLGGLLATRRRRR